MMQTHNNSCQECPNNDCFIKECSPEWLKYIDEKKTVSTYLKGQNIIISGSGVFGIYFIKNGKIKVTAKGRKEHDQIVRLATNGHIVGHRGLAGETYPISAIAFEDSVICFADNDTFYEILINNPRVTYNLMMFYSQELRGIEARINYMAQMTVLEKVIFALLYLKDTFGYNEVENVLNININRSDIAALAGISEEQVARSLTYLAKEKLIAKVSRKIRLLKMDELKYMIELYR